MKLPNLNLRGTLALLMVNAMTPLLLMMGYGIFQFNHIIQLERKNFDQSIRQAGLVNKATTAFQTPVREWKNVLPRGQAQDQYHTHLQRFYAAERRSRAFVMELLSTAQNDSAVVDGVNRFIRSHKLAGKIYRQALRAFNESDTEAQSAADLVVKNVERAPVDYLTVLGRIIEQRREIRRAILAEKLNAIILSWGLVSAAVVLGNLLLLVWIFNRRVADPLRSGIAAANRIAEGDTSMPLETGRGDEFGQLLYALETMRNSIRKHTEGLEQAVVNRTKELMNSEARMLRA